MKIHHIGMITKNIEKSLSIYEKLGFKKTTEIIQDYIQMNNILFINNESVTIELIEPINKESSIYNFKDGMHHICYEIGNIDKFINTFKNLEIGKIITKPIKAVAIENRSIVFGCLKNGEFIEFLF